MRGRAASSAIVATVVALACGGDSSGPEGVFQVASVTITSGVVQCGTNPISHITSAVPESLLINVHLVNTSDTDVSVNSVASIGTVIQASDPAAIGQQVTTFGTLNFTPQPVLVRAKDGDVTMVVRLPMAGSCVQPSPPAPPLQFKDTNTSIRVFTTAGLFVSSPMTLHLNFVGGGS